jgi:hypothetical protein
MGTTERQGANLTGLSRDRADARDSLRDRSEAVSEPYNFDVEARMVCNAIGSNVGHMTVRCALHEAYEAALRERPAPPAGDVQGLRAVLARQQAGG